MRQSGRVGGGDMRGGAQLAGKGGRRGWGGQGRTRPKAGAETWSVLRCVGLGGLGWALAAVEDLCLHAGNSPPSVGLDTKQKLRATEAWPACKGLLGS